MIRHSIALSLLLIAALAAPAHALVGQVNVYVEDQKGDPAKDVAITWSAPIKTSWTMNIQETWNKEKDPEVNDSSEAPPWKSQLTAPQAWNILTTVAWATDLVVPGGFAGRLLESESTAFLGFLYFLETEDPYCRFYNMVDDWWSGMITTDQYYALARQMSQFRDYDGPWNYATSYITPSRSDSIFYTSSMNEPRYHLSQGLVAVVDHIDGYDSARYRTGEDGKAPVIENTVGRAQLGWNVGAGIEWAPVAVLEGANYYSYSLTQPVTSRYVTSWEIPGKSFQSLRDIFKDDYAVTEKTNWKIGTDYRFSTAMSYGYDGGLTAKFNKVGLTYEFDPTWDIKITPNDPLYASKGSWSQSYADQWALQRIGFKPLEDPASAWRVTTGTERPVVVAVIDTGIDLTHPDLNIDNLWKNSKESAGNGRDDDANGFIDDLIGWNFVENNNNPYDLAGHGTHVAGLIAARWNNGRGIAGINRGARIMALKAFNDIGKAWGSDVARALVYAVDNGAKIVNISAGHEGHTKFMEKAFAYAQQKGALVVVAAGNEAVDAAKTEPANQPGTLVVAATQPDDKRVGFSNWGPRVNLAAPGVDVLSLRAHGTDIVRRVATDPSKAKPGEAAVGAGEKQYYRASGTSFAAPLVSGVASLMLAKNPSLTAEQIKRMLTMSADDIETPGWDLLTGYGMLNARKALEADPNYYLYTELHRVAPAREGGRTVIQVFGTAMGSDLSDYHIEVGQGENPASWKPAGKAAGGQIKENLLGTLTQTDFGGSGRWTVRLVAQDKKGLTRESRSSITLQ